MKAIAVINIAMEDGMYNLIGNPIYTHNIHVLHTQKEISTMIREWRVYYQTSNQLVDMTRDTQEGGFMIRFKLTNNNSTYITFKTKRIN